METIFGVALCFFLGAAVITSMTINLRFASCARLMTNARAIVQRNIEAADGIAFSGTSSTPAILVPTVTAGVICDDDGGSGAPVENIQVLSSGTNVLVTGTLTRIVTSEPVIITGTADASVIVRRVTFQVDYDYQTHHYTYSETTLRSADTQ